MGSVKDRGVMWTNSLKLFYQHPVIGIGLNTFYVNYAKVREDEYKDKKGSYAHNCYLQMAVETGVLGLTAFLFLILTVIFKAVKYIVSSRYGEYYWLVFGLTAGIAAFLFHSAVDTNLYSLPLATLFWLGMGVLMSAIKISEGLA
jgi:putative inorganic carbon (HCO3(-)) transporter